MLLTPEAALQLMPAFEQVLSSVRPDLVQAGPTQLCGFMAALADVQPFLLMTWGSDILVDTNRNAYWRWVTHYTLRKADAVLCDSQAVEEKIQQLAPGVRKVLTFPWGINRHQVKHKQNRLTLIEDLGWDNCFIVFSNRSWEPVYNINTLIDAFEQAHHQYSHSRLLLLGDGSLRADIQASIAAKNLNRAIYQAGRISEQDMPRFLDLAHVYVSCAYSDGTSISLLEAMGQGLPVIVSDIPSNREWVAHTRNGWLAPAGDPDTFAKYMIAASLLSSEQREQIAQDNRSIIRQRADWDENINLLLRYFDTLTPTVIISEPGEVLDAYRSLRDHRSCATDQRATGD